MYFVLCQVVQCAWKWRLKGKKSPTLHCKFVRAHMHKVVLVLMSLKTNPNLSSIQSGYCICMKCCERFFLVSFDWFDAQFKVNVLSLSLRFFSRFFSFIAQDYEWMLKTIAYTSCMEIVVLKFKNETTIQSINLPLFVFAQQRFSRSGNLMKKNKQPNITTRFKQISSALRLLATASAKWTAFWYKLKTFNIWNSVNMFRISCSIHPNTWLNLNDTNHCINSHILTYPIRFRRVKFWIDSECAKITKVVVIISPSI